jgi:hypothetical protein
MKRAAIGIIIAVAIVLVVGFVPLVGVAYQDTETYYVDEPYQVTENYTEDVQTQLEIVEDSLVSGLLPSVQGKVKNTGNQTLYWADVTIWVEYEIEGLPGRTFTQPGSLDPIPTTFMPGEIRDFSVLVQEGTTSYEITPPTITQTVERQRTVTEYRQVERERTVTRYKKGTVFEYLRSRF